MSTYVTLTPNVVTWESYPVLVRGTGTGGLNGALICIQDNSDTTYIEADWNSLVTDVNVHYTNYSLASNERCRSVTQVVRAARDPSGASSQAVTNKLYVVATNSTGAFINTFTTSRTGTAISTTNGPRVLLADIPTGVRGPAGRVPRSEWDQSRINGIATQLEWKIVGKPPSAGYLRTYQLNVILEIVKAPTVSGAPYLSNVTNNANPTVNWVYVDPDNGTQRGFQVRVFDNTTVGASNFTADRSAAVWDSGDIYRSDQSINVDAALQNGKTYYAYVRVAKEGVGNDAHWWSGWYGSASFPIAFTPPYTPTIQSVVPISDANQYRMLVTTVMPINMLNLDNSSFEIGLGNWTAASNCAIARDTAQHADGIASMKMTSTAGGDMTAHCDVDSLSNPRVDLAATYTAVASVKAAVSARSCAVGIEWLDNSSSVLSTVYGANITDGTSGYTQASVTGDAPASAIHARVIVKVLAAGAGAEVHWVDKVDIHVGTTVAWTPGGYVNDQNGLVLERGDMLTTTRGPAQNWIHPQVAGGGQTRNAGQGFSWNSAVSTLHWLWSTVSLPGNGNQAGMLRWTNLANSGTPVVEIGRSFYGTFDYMAPCIPSQAHTFSVWVWCDTGTASVAPRITYRDKTGASFGAQVGATVTATTTPQRLQVTATAPAGAFYMHGGVGNPTHDIDKHLYFTRAGIGPGTLPVDDKQPAGQDVEWRPVQFSQDGDPDYLTGFPPGYTVAQVARMPDYEYSPGRAVLYRTSIVYSSNAGNWISAYDYGIGYGAAPPVTLLRSVTNPLLQVAVNRRKQLTTTISEDAQVFHPLGSDGAPIKIRDWVGGEDGTLTVVISTEAQAARMRDIIRSSDTLLVHWAQGGKSYILITGVGIDEILSSDVNFCDADGQQGWLRYDVISLAYVETEL